MIKYVISNKDYRKVLRVEEAEPECGKDFCDKCGDCLYCYDYDPCYIGDTDDHLWVTYEDK